MISLQGFIATELHKQNLCPDKYKQLISYGLVPDWYNKIYDGDTLWNESNLRFRRNLRYLKTSGNPLDWTKTIEFKCNVITNTNVNDSSTIPFRFVYPNGYFSGIGYICSHFTDTRASRFVYYEYHRYNVVEDQQYMSTQSLDAPARKSRNYWIKIVWNPQERRWYPYFAYDAQAQNWHESERQSYQVPQDIDMNQVIIEPYSNMTYIDATIPTSSIQIIQDGIVVLDGSQLMT